MTYAALQLNPQEAPVKLSLIGGGYSVNIRRRGVLAKIWNVTEKLNSNFELECFTGKAEL